MKIDNNSIVLGIGIGFIILSLVLYGINPNVWGNTADELSDEYITLRARKLGMVTVDEALHTLPEMSDMEIVDMAREMGMVFAYEIEDSVDESTDVSEPPALIPEPPTISPEPTTTPTPLPEFTPIPTPVTSPSQNEALLAPVRIPPDTNAAGVAEILYINGIIADESEFAVQLRRAIGGEAVESGFYIFPKLADYEILLDILLDRNR